MLISGHTSASEVKLACEYTHTSSGNKHDKTYKFDPVNLTLNGHKNGEIFDSNDAYHQLLTISDTEISIKIVFNNGYEEDTISRIDGSYAEYDCYPTRKQTAYGHCSILKQVF
jgi:hypothetical protein